MKKQALVVGSGISGLSIAKILLEENCDVKVLEKCNELGGLIKCGRIEGNLFHYVGGHVFNSKNGKVLEWFWKHFDRDKEFLRASRNAKIFMDNKFYGYPIENYLYQLPEKDLRLIINELVNANHDEEEFVQYSNFKDFLIGKFGQTLYNLYFGPYNNKVWNIDISEVPLEWLDGKLPMPNTEEVLLSNILRKEETGMVHSSFYYPKNDGSQFVIDRLAEGLDIDLCYEVSGISLEEGKVIVASSLHKSYKADFLIYTGDVRNLHSIISTQDDELKEALLAVTTLLSNGTSNVLCETDDNDISWLYLPEQKFKAHRIIYTGNFSESNNAGTERKTCVVEFSGKHEQEEMRNELQHLPGNLKPLAFNYQPNSYIIHQSDTRFRIKTLKTLLAKYNVYLLGRFAEWEYFNMDKCIESAMTLTSRVLEASYSQEQVF